MTLVFVKGQNAPLAAQQLRIMVDAAVAVDLSALLLTETGASGPTVTSSSTTSRRRRG